MINPKEIKIKINSQGAPVVNNAVIYYQNNKIVIIEVDMKSKWCQIDYTTGINSIGIGATDRSCWLDKTKDKESYTEISFPEFKEYETWTCSLNRYTLRICLVKNIYEE